MSVLTAFVQNLPTLDPKKTHNRRRFERVATCHETVARPVDWPEAMSWGASVNDLSQGGIGLTLCFPFQLGTLLTIDLKKGSALLHSATARVVHVHDKSDGTWDVGCQFTRDLSPTEWNKLA